MSKRIPLNDEYFEQINSAEKAYFLGLLMSDGSLETNSNRIRLALQYCDKDILDKFKNSIEYKGLVRDYRYSTHIAVLNLCSKKNYEYLVKLGCTPKKSLTLEFPENKIPDEFMRHFVRGYFDGDGSFIYNKKRKNATFCVLSTLNFCKILQKYLKNMLNIDGYVASTYSKAYVYKVHGNLAFLKIGEWMYNDSNLYLERKRKKYLYIKQCIHEKRQNFINFCRNKKGEDHPTSILTNDIVRQIKIDLKSMTVSEVAKKHKLKYNNVHPIHLGITWSHIEI